ncbi:hypothetical protein CHS0354_002109 [Potamilus streckersoni]|uniref:Uncharacterized protein n=1 Tax=Potamilus streckersoni TaxID=2493646 RepID=A0AAE0TIS2_9BIVA|nr:hypothetical protein CHS0354_002109 [Potamilus streckersoni]
MSQRHSTVEKIRVSLNKCSKGQEGPEICETCIEKKDRELSDDKRNSFILYRSGKSNLQPSG